MNATYVYEKGPSRSTVHRYEEEIARRWQALPLHMYLPLSNGESCQLLHTGRPGGSLGPDVRDAVLHFTSRRAATPFLNGSSQQGENTVGDVEIFVPPATAPCLWAPLAPCWRSHSLQRVSGIDSVFDSLRFGVPPKSPSHQDVHQGVG